MSMSVDVVPEGEFRVWWNPKEPDEIHLVTNDSVFHDDAGGRPGMWVTFSSKLDSANYHPANFNRCARALKEHNEPQGKPYPAEVPEHDRRIKNRAGLIAKFKKGLLGPNVG